MLRSVLAQNPSAVYALGWSPHGDSILFPQKNTLLIKPIQPSGKSEAWKAHDGGCTVPWPCL